MLLYAQVLSALVQNEASRIEKALNVVTRNALEVRTLVAPSEAFLSVRLERVVHSYRVAKDAMELRSAVHF